MASTLFIARETAKRDRLKNDRFSAFERSSRPLASSCVVMEKNGISMSANRSNMTFPFQFSGSIRFMFFLSGMVKKRPDRMPLPARTGLAVTHDGETGGRTQDIRQDGQTARTVPFSLHAEYFSSGPLLSRIMKEWPAKLLKGYAVSKRPSTMIAAVEPVPLRYFAPTNRYRFRWSVVPPGFRQPVP